MAYTGPQTAELPSNEERRGYVERVLSSVTFSNAPVLKSFLEFIVSLSEEGRSDEISEYAIAAQVFGRPPKFDPASDTIVRTQAYRLRLKLKEYYEREGKDDGITIQIPKGHYVPIFQFRSQNGLHELVPPNEVPVRPESISAAPTAVRGGKLRIRVTRVVLLAFLVFVCGFAIGTRWSNQWQSALATKLTQGVEAQFWTGFLNSGRHITVSYMDLHYLVSESGLLFSIHGESPMAERAVPADPKNAANPKLAAAAGRLYYENGYAALGDMLAVHRLALLFTTLGANTTVTRAHQITLDELRNNSLVFLGDFQDRGTVIWLPEHWPWRFAFRNASGLWGKYIVDTGAPAGADSHFGLGRDPDSGVIRTDYALVSVIPGVTPTHRIVNLAGLTTSGTQGAAEFMSSEAGLRELLTAIGTKQNGYLVFPRFFQCVVRVEVAHGIDVISTKYVTGAAFEPKR